MDIISHVSQQEMKNLVGFALLAIKTISCHLSLATLKESTESRCCFVLPSSFSAGFKCRISLEPNLTQELNACEVQRLNQLNKTV